MPGEVKHSTQGKCVTCRRLHILPGHNCLRDRTTIKKSVKVSSKISEEKGIAQFSKPQRCAEPATSQIDSIVLRVQLRKVQSYSAAHWMRDPLLHLVSVYILLERDMYIQTGKRVSGVAPISRPEPGRSCSPFWGVQTLKEDFQLSNRVGYGFG